MKQFFKQSLGLSFFAIILFGCKPATNVLIEGELKKWHRITLLMDGPQLSETDEVNPFLNYRLDVTFTNGEERFVVPGFFAADGDAAETKANSGNKWKVHFTPNQIGEWKYSVSFMKGERISVEDNLSRAKSAGYMDGVKGIFTVVESDKTGRDNRANGRLEYVGEHFLKYAESGKYFMKQGADTPENFLAYEDFDNTPNYKNFRKSWEPHIRDWKTGDPTWQGGKGKGILGAINYLASKGMNVFSFLTYNVGGDDRNVFPMISDEKADRTRYDVSKLEQWEIVFEHGDNKGMYLHFKLQERENDGGHATEDMDVALDEGNLGVERKLYIRELVARFGHHLALNWNLGEENEQTTAQIIDMAEYIIAIDPYQHHIVLHTTPGLEKQRSIYMPLIGEKSALTGVSIQGGENDYADIYPKVAEWVSKSAEAGKKWVVANDEQAKGSHGILPDDEPENNQDLARKRVIWGTIMAGGAGCEYYFGYKYPHSDMTCEDYRSRDKWWDFARFALQFFEKNEVPFWQMTPSNEYVEDVENWCLAQPGLIYVLFLLDGGSPSLDLSDELGSFQVHWYNPRNGGDLHETEIMEIAGGDIVSLGSPPKEADQDWVVLVRSSGE
ncbi:MAG: DUF5060 domain-containing protein [Cyclobacteriaceae bacterium]